MNLVVADATIGSRVNQETDIKVTVSSAGVFELFAEGVSVGTATDTTYTESAGVTFDCTFQNGPIPYLDNYKETIYYSSETYTSDAFNATSISSWSTLSVTDATNGLSRTYSVRLATTEGELDTATWATITPGSIINAAITDEWIQWKVDVTFVPTLDYLQIDDVTVNYSQGGTASQNIYAASNENRYCVTATSGTASSNNIMLCKSKNPLNTFMLHDMQLGPMTKFNDGFYAAASTHSAIYTLNQGTNDNGATIDWFWQSRDELWKLPNNRKNLHEITIDFRKDSAENMEIGYSKDSGVTFNTSTVDMSGAGRSSKRIYLNGGNSLQYRFQIKNDTKDEDARITGVTGWARPWEIRE